MKKALLFLVHAALCSCISAQTLVKDINPGKFGSLPINFVALGNLTLFIASDKEHGNELWKTDGTTANTSLILDINPGSTDALQVDAATGPNYTPLVALGNRIYFFADDGISGLELWSSDGTTSGTSRVKDINAGSAGASDYLKIKSLFSNGNQLYFSADDGTHGSELWKSDGTPSGTVMVKDINPSGSSGPIRFFADGSSVYFNADDGVHGSELWKSDGTPSGTTLLADINKGSASSGIEEFIKFHNNIYFSADDGVDSYELWKTDGTTPGTQLVTGTFLNGRHMPNDYVIFNDRLVFSAFPGNGKSELWSSDGTAAGTAPLKDTSFDFDSGTLTPFKGKLFFSGNDGVDNRELWTSDGTRSGTSLFCEINKLPAKPSNPWNYIVANGNLYFNANDGVNGAELWKTDGTLSGTVMLNQICPGSCGSFPLFLFQNGNTLFFDASEPVTGVELYKLDLSVTGVPVLSENHLLAYPNPFSDQVEISGTEATGEFILFDILGKEITRQKATSVNTTIHTENLFPGVYILHYLNGNKTIENIKVYKGND